MYVDIERMQVRQTLEGPRDVVLALYAKIKADGRHFVFEEDLEPVTQRHFSCWGMKDMSELEVPAYMEPSRARPPSPNWLQPTVSDDMDSDYDPFGDPFSVPFLHVEGG